MRNFSYLGIGLTIVLLAIGCSARQSIKDEAPELDVQLLIQPDPPLVGAATLNLLVSSDEGDPIENADLVVRGDMTHPGMVPVIGELEATGSGNYAVQFEWTMAGFWIVSISGELPDGRYLLRTFEVLVEMIK